MKAHAEEAIRKVEAFLMDRRPTSIERSDLSSRFVLLSILLTLSTAEKLELIDLLGQFHHSSRHLLEECKSALISPAGSATVATELRILPNLIGYVLDYDLGNFPMVVVPSVHNMALFDNGIRVLA
jgi:hypothetical protein